MLGKFASDPRVVAVAWHVDYFNEPWKDPFSDPRHSAREAEYSRIYNRERSLENPGILYLTPLMMIDGRQPLVGSHADAEARARAALVQALRQPAELSLHAEVTREGEQILTHVRLRKTRESPSRSGECLLGLVLTEDRLSTRVRDGELKNQDYHARHVARAFTVTPASWPAKSDTPSSASLRLTIPHGVDPARASLVLFAQDETTGRILSARKLPLPGQTPGSTNRPAEASR